MTEQKFRTLDAGGNTIGWADRAPLRVVYYCFPGGKHKVLTCSYDDGRPEDRRLVEMFNSYGIRGTFNINSVLTQDERIPLEEMPELYRGHEVASHTAMHPTIERSPNEQIVLQTLEDRRLLEHVMHYPVRGMAYPNGSFDERIESLLKACGIVYGRTTISSHSYKMPTDFLLWNPTVYHTEECFLPMAEEFVKLYKRAYSYIFYVWGHSYELTQNHLWGTMEKFCQMAGGQDDIWYATNVQIVDYMAAVRALQVGVNVDFVYNPSAISVWLAVDDDHIYECRPGVITPLD